MKRSPTFRLLAVFVAFPLFLVGGCPPFVNPTNTGDNDQKGPATLKKFSSANELLDYFRTQANKQFGGNVYQRDFFNLGGLPTAAPAAEDSAGGDASNGPGGGSGASFTTTNLQEEGVDESDIVKSDGTYFYIAKGRSLRIVKAAPQAEMAEVGRLDVDSYIQSMYLVGDKVILLSSNYGYFDGPMPASSMIWPPYFQNGSVEVIDVSVADRTSPALAKKMQIDGSLVDSRLLNGQLFLVISIVPDLPSSPLALNFMTLDDVLPQMRGSDGAVSTLVPWAEFYRPGASDGYYMSAVVTLDAADIDRVTHSTAVISNASTIYASQNALYITDADYDPDDHYRENTAIHKFAIGEDGSALYVASGSVGGRLLNQFSLSEHEGNLRVATHVADNGWIFAEPGGPMIAVNIAVDDVTVVDSATVGAGDEPVSTDAEPPSNGDTTPADDDADAAPSSPPQPYNKVSVLSQNGDRLEVAGELTNIAPGERIYSTRFMGDKLFMVTFVQIDPLFVIDLSNPAAPTILGELKVPGFSDYLHPLDETHLIGIGRSVAQSPWGGIIPTGLQLSLFDVSDYSNPTVVQQITIGGHHSGSDVSYTHKAFALTEDGVLAIPAQLTKTNLRPDEWDQPEFDGVIVYRVDASTGFTQLGRVSGVMQSDYWGWTWASWRRPALIGDVVYAITDQGVRAAPLSDFTATTTVELAPGLDDILPGDIDKGDSVDGSGGASEPGRWAP